MYTHGQHVSVMPSDLDNGNTARHCGVEQQLESLLYIGSLQHSNSTTAETLPYTGLHKLSTAPLHQSSSAVVPIVCKHYTATAAAAGSRSAQ
eukprot:21328-Heterococcus_DN1.PRE.2